MRSNVQKERERRRDYDDYDDEPPRRRGKRNSTRTLAIVAGVLAACLVVVLLFKSILTSFNNPVQDQFAVPSVIGMPVEEAETLPEVNRDLYH